MLLLILTLLACGDKDNTTTDGGGTDGGTADGGTDGGTADGGTTDGGTSDGGTTDGGTTDGGTTDGGGTDGGGTDGGTTDGGAGDGGAGDGGSSDGGSGDGGSGDGGSGDGGSGDGGSSDGGSGDGGSGDGGSATREDCTNGIDDDGDGLADCADSECARHPDCATASTCPDGDLRSATGDAVASGSLDSSAGDDFSGTCGARGAADHAYAWAAPASACYQIDTHGSDFDTVLRIFDACDGAEMDCSDDSTSGTTSELKVETSRGESLLLVVDGYSRTSTGSYLLNINEVRVDLSTYDTDIGRSTGDGVASGAFAGGEPSRLEASCGYGGGDFLVRWVVPETATWVLDTSSSTLDTTLSVWADEGCGELDCNDDYADLTSYLALDLDAGTEVVVRVGAYSTYSTGEWTLDINKL